MSASTRTSTPGAKRGATGPAARAAATRKPGENPRPSFLPPEDASPVAAKQEAAEPFSFVAFVQVWWTVFFALGVLAMQSVVEPKQGWEWPPKLDLSFAAFDGTFPLNLASIEQSQLYRVFSSPLLWACWGPMLLGILVLRRFFRAQKLDTMEKGMMVWWLTNIFFFHTACDILSGYYQVMPALADLYSNMTPQHQHRQWADPRLHLDTVYFMELTVEVPLAIAVLMLYFRRHPGRYFVETFAVAVQLAGTVIYYTPPLIRREATASWVCYFDRGFGSVWIMFPLFVLHRHFSRAVQEAEAKKVD